MRSLLPLGLAVALTASLAAQPGLPTYEQVDLTLVRAQLEIAGTGAGSRLGTAVATGDMNGDGIDDLAVSEPGADTVEGVDSGRILVFDGRDLQGTVDLAALEPLTIINGEGAGNQIGQSLAFGFVDNDEFAELVIGAPFAPGFNGSIGAVYLIEGRSQYPDEFSIGGGAPLTITRFFAPLTNTQGDFLGNGFGTSVATGTFTLDDRDEIMIGAPLHGFSGSPTSEGRVYVVYGRDDISGNVNLNTASSTRRLIIEGVPDLSTLGSTVAAGDFDGDGFVDCCIGAPGPGLGGLPGAAYVVYGQENRPGLIDLSSAPLTPPAFTTILPNTNSAPQGELGRSLATGFYNRDTQADLLLAATVYGDDGINPRTGAVFIVRGQQVRTPEINLNTFPGTSHALLVGSVPGDFFGLESAMIDVNGDGLDDPVVLSPFFELSSEDPATDRGGIFALLSDGSFPASPIVMDENTPSTWLFLGRQPGRGLTHVITRGDLNGDAVEDLLLTNSAYATPGADQGQLFAFPSILTHPRLVRVTLVEQEDADQNIQNGDRIVLTFDRPINLVPGPITSGSFFITNDATLGVDSVILASTARPNVLVVRLLGPGTANLRVDGDDPDDSAFLDISAFTNLVITDALTGVPAVDNGVSGVNDVGIDLRWALGANMRNIDEFGDSFMSMQNQSDARDFEYTRHGLSIPEGALTDVFNFGLEALPINDNRNFGLTSLARITTSADPSETFLIPSAITLEYNDQDVDRFAGQIEGLVRPFLINGPDILNLPLAAPFVQDTETKTIEFELTNLDPIGLGEEPGLFATLPVNPVEERSINIAPSAAASAEAEVSLIVPTGAGAGLTPGPGSGYLFHTVSFPGFQVTSDTDPARTEVTIRQANLFERIHPAPQTGANLFPTQSGAIFVVETRDSAGAPFGFASPVNVSVQYISRSSPDTTDVVDFNAVEGTVSQMRVVRSRVDTSVGPDFQISDAAQSNIPGEGLATASGITDLTGSNGLGAWGAVVDPSFQDITLEQTLDHLLGVNVLTDPTDLNLADVNGDSRVDVADVVSRVPSP